MSQNTNVPSPDPYRVDSLQEVDKILLQLLRQGVLLRMHDSNDHHSVITTLLDIDFEHDTIVIDSAAQQTINEQLLANKMAYFEAILDSVSVKFQVASLYTTTFEDRPALAGALPNFLYRIQRRETFRVRPTLGNTAHCAITLHGQVHTFDVYDISSTGLALIDPNGLLTDHIQQTLPDCELTLPHIGVVTVDLQLVRAQSQLLGTGKKRPLVGCAFSHIEANPQIRIQNFIMAEERLQIARDRGLA